jgi:membrane protein required for colicin V production
MNLFDALVTAAALVAIVMGFISGLLRSVATILGYLLAAPLAVAITPRIVPFVLGSGTLPPDQSWLPVVVVFIVFVAFGIAFGVLFRNVLNELVDDEIGLFDRVAGAILGAVRIFLVAVLVVVVFDRIIPADHEPPFLVGSKLRPYLSAAGQKGLETLPPDVDDYIDRLKRERGI